MRKLLAILICLNMTLAPLAIGADTPAASGDQFRSSQGGGGGWMDQILGITSGAIGSTIIVGCSLSTMQPSLMAYMAGGVAYIAKEILGGKGQGNFHKKSASALKMDAEKMKGGDVQKAALETALADEKKNLEMIKSRKMWMMAITAAYTAATGLAIMESMKEKVPPYITSFAGCNATPVSGFQAMAISAAYGAASNMGNGMGGMIMGGAGSLLFQKVLTSSILVADTAKATSHQMADARMIAFGASAALALLVTMELGKKEKVFKENVEKLENAIANYKAESSSSSGIGDGSTSGSAAGAADVKPTLVSGAITPLPTVETELAKHCMSKTGNYSEESCSSVVRIPNPKLEGNINVPTLQNAANLANEMGNAVASGNIGQANIAAAGLAGMATQLSEVKKNLQKQLNDQLKLSGKAPRDFDAEEKARLAQMRNSISSNPNWPQLASLEANSLKNLGVSALDVTKENASASNEKIVGGPALAMPSSTITEGVIPSEPTVEPTKVAEVNMNEQFEYNEKDVSEKKEESIFKQVSNRYIFNYPRLFSKNEPQPVENSKK